MLSLFGNATLLLLLLALNLIGSGLAWPVLVLSVSEGMAEDKPQAQVRSSAETEAKDNEAVSVEKSARGGEDDYNYEEADILEEELPLEEGVGKVSERRGKEGGNPPKAEGKK